MAAGTDEFCLRISATKTPANEFRPLSLQSQTDGKVVGSLQGTDQFLLANLKQKMDTGKGYGPVLENINLQFYSLIDGPSRAVEVTDFGGNGIFSKYGVLRKDSSGNVVLSFSNTSDLIVDVMPNARTSKY